MTEKTRLVALDWGTTALRAYVLGQDGSILESRSGGRGMMQVDPEGGFEAALAEILVGLPDAPLIACGMVGSRQGWREAPYVECPADLGKLCEGVLTIERPGRQPLRIVPGLVAVGSDGVPDVMRGEETQVLGALNDDRQVAMFVLPGTHSKWAMWDGNRITGFATFMTGEAFALFKAHSILGRQMMGESEDAGAFAEGVAISESSRAGPLHDLFGVRTRGLVGQLPSSAAASYLSGILIGTEIAGARRLFVRLPDVVTVIGSGGLAAKYAAALESVGCEARIAPGAAAARGLFTIATAIGL